MDEKIKNLSSASLAYLGDAVFELMVREMLVNSGELTLGDFNEAAKSFVSAKAQSGLYHRIFDMLTEEEKAVMKRGRNLSTQSRAKNASMSDYRHATGLETLFGYLYSEKRYGRLKEIFDGLS